MDIQPKARKPPFSCTPLKDLVGRWESKFESPPVRIYKLRQSYRIEFEYKFGYNVMAKIKAIKDRMTYELFWLCELAYDEKTDTLIIAGEGIYNRVQTNN